MCRLFQEETLWLYLLNGRLRKGLPITLKPDPRIVVGAGDVRKVLPLGGSLDRLLVGDEADMQEEFLLQHADIEESNAGLVLTEQTREQAQQDGRALLGLQFFKEDPKEGYFIAHRKVRDRSFPQLLESRVILFHPGDAVAVQYRSPIAEMAVRLLWDGRTLVCQGIRQ